MEYHYKLAAYVIPCKILPIGDESKFLMTSLQETMEEQKKKQFEHNKATLLKCQMENTKEQEILLVWGCPLQVFPGNLHLKRIIDELLSWYQVMEIGEKCAMVADDKKTAELLRWATKALK
jgi:hypothetical protein